MAEKGAGRRGGLLPLTYAVAVLGAAVVAVFSILTQVVHHRAQQHLLDLRVREAASTLAAALPNIQAELDDSLQVAQATGSPAAFQRFVTQRILVSPGFTSVSLWKQSAGAPDQVALAGSPPVLVADGLTGFLASLRPAAALQITPIIRGGPSGAIGYAAMHGSGGLIVYAESDLPPGRKVKVAPTNPFHDIEFALYLNSVKPSNLIEETGSGSLPPGRAHATAPFGNASIVLVGATRVDLAGGLSASLPWIVLGVGFLLTAGAATMAEALGRRRRVAEGLAEENERLYLEQRNIATTVQHALLPEVPKLEELEVGARYLAGTAGIEVGGDWYDLVCEPGKCTFVVGDVCGRGLRAATTMASLRFATRAYIAQGDGPAQIVGKLGRLQDFGGDELFATLLIGELDIPSRRLTLVNAGHPPLLLVTPQGSTFVDMPPNPPVGVDWPEARSTTIELPENMLLIAFTDGLIERRDLPVEEGMARLRAVAIDPADPVDVTLDRLVETLLPAGAVDDTAILAIRWRPDGRSGRMISRSY